jgi:hypothetical protein
MEETAGDGLLVSAYFIWMAFLVINVLHFSNLYSLKKMERQEGDKK